MLATLVGMKRTGSSGLKILSISRTKTDIVGLPLMDTQSKRLHLARRKSNSNLLRSFWVSLCS
jgi:hypothetical protein